MKEKSLTRHYQFRATEESPTAQIKRHLIALRTGHESMFEKIDIDTLACDPEAVNILTTACETVSLAIAGHKHQQKTGQPFYLAIGENHASPAHMLHHILALESMRKEDIPFTLSEERGEAFALQVLIILTTDELDRPLTNQELKTVGQTCKESILHKRYTIFDTFIYAPYTTSMIVDPYILKLYQNQMVLPTDAPKTIFITNEQGTSWPKSSDFLDMDHPLTKQAIQSPALQEKWKEKIKSLGQIPMRSTTSMAIRNLHTIKSVLLGNIKPTNNIVHIGGRNHVLSKDPQHSDSTLVAYADKAGFQAIGRPLYSDGHSIIKRRLTPWHYRRQKIARPISDITFDHRYTLDENPDYTKRGLYKEEQTYTDTRLESLGRTDLIVHDPEATATAQARHILSLAKELAEKFKENERKQNPHVVPTQNEPHLILEPC